MYILPKKLKNRRARRIRKHEARKHTSEKRKTKKEQDVLLDVNSEIYKKRYMEEMLRNIFSKKKVEYCKENHHKKD